MNVVLWILLLMFIGLMFLVLSFCSRRRRSSVRLRQMEMSEKLGFLNGLLEPFGFSCLPIQDIITTRRDAWQREFGYREVFDRTAVGFHMVFDCEPVYFHYDNKTWLIEFWKGQYGINIGGEIGLYYVDEILQPEEYEDAHFMSAPDEWMIPMALEMYYKGDFLFGLKRQHWWLTGFQMGCFAQPENLAMKVMLTFPDEEMLGSFMKSLYRMGYSECDVCVCAESVWLTFSAPHTLQPRQNMRLKVRLIQRMNRLLVRMFRWFTRPFESTVDRLLYLYFCLPFVVRRILCFRKNKGQK